jgi:predicted acylesterase/phospholipase RssA
MRSAVLLCLASAALPFGFVAPIELNGKDLHDGGVIDNVPVFPMVRRAKRLFVVLMEISKLETDEQAASLDIREKSGLTAKHWQEIARLLDLAALKVPQCPAGNYDDLPRPVVTSRKVEQLPEMLVFPPRSHFLRGGGAH